jgi:DNA sulfur modification protein DndD
MRIRKLELSNFGPYHSTQTVEFPQDAQRNIYIFWGKNHAGKTHIMQAIKWGLYGWDVSPRDKPRFPNEKDAWNFLYGTHKDPPAPPSGHMHVYLWLQDGNNKYLVKRMVTPRSEHTKPKSPSDIDLKFEVEENGRTNNSPREAIETLLPTAASQFFFFHGEEIRDISQKHLDQTRKAIELILEAETFRVARGDVDSVGSDIERELDDIRQREGVQDLVEEKRRFEANIEKQKQGLEDLRIKLQQNNTNLEEVETNLRNHQTSERLIGRLDGLRKDRTQFIDRRKDLLDKRAELLIDLPLQMILPELRKILATKEQAHRRIEEQRQASRELAGSFRFAEKLLKAKQCVCGRPIGTVEREYIESHAQDLKTKAKDAENAIEKEDPTYYQIRETIASIESTTTDFQGYQKEIDDVEQNLDEIETQIKGIEKSLGTIDQQQIMTWTAQRNALNKDIGRVEDQIEVMRKHIEDLEKGRDSVEAMIKRKEIRDAIKQDLQNQFALSKKTSDAIDYILSNLVEVRKASIEKYSTEIFRLLTNDPDEYDRLAIDADYNVSVIDKKGIPRLRHNLSTGERHIVALSFIFGLMKASEKVAPLVLDTFFSHLDKAHLGNIIKALPLFAEQIILILTDVEYEMLQTRAGPEVFEHVAMTCKVSRNEGEESSSIAPPLELEVKA